MRQWWHDRYDVERTATAFSRGVAWAGFWIGMGIWFAGLFISFSISELAQ